MSENDPQFCYLTTTGRVSGKPHEIEIWFGRAGPNKLFLLSGGGEKSDWVRNLHKQPDVRVRVGNVTYVARARVLERDTEEDAKARRLLFERYSPTYKESLESWRETSLPVALDLGEPIA